MVNVIVLFSKIEEAKAIKNLLVRNGISVTKICTTGAQAAQAADAYDEGVVICGYRYPDMIFSDLKTYLPPHFDMIVIASRSHYEQCKKSGVTTLTMPLKSADFVRTVAITVERILKERKARKAAPKVRTEAEKNAIGTAKLKLMDNHGYTEEEAHRYLQKKCMDTGVSLVDMAYMVLEGTGLFKEELE